MHASSQISLGGYSSISYERTYLVVSEGSFNFLAIFLDEPCIVRSGNESGDSILCFERLQYTCDGVQFPEMNVAVSSPWPEN